jgi:hypothetical protein
MDKLELPLEGGCRCGKFRFRIEAAPLLTMACHCRGCQKMSASVFSLSAAIPSAGFSIIKGEVVVGGLHADDLHHHHCDWCKSWVFTRIEPDMGFVNVRATMLDDASWFVPFIETYTSEALAWVKTPARHSYAKFPPMEAY